VTIPAVEAVTHFQFAQGEIAVGDGIFANVDVSGLHGSGSTTDGPEKAPERVYVFLSGNFGNNYGGSSSSASGSDSHSAWPHCL